MNKPKIAARHRELLLEAREYFYTIVTDLRGAGKDPRNFQEEQRQLSNIDNFLKSITWED